MEIKKEVADAVQMALKNRRYDETFERTFGKAVRRKHLAFSDYVEAMSAIRERAREKSISLEEAASELISE